MANQKSIARWVLSNKSALSPSFVRLDWPERYFPGIWDFETTLHIGGITAVGRGIDHDKDLALEKSCAEAVERFICIQLGIDSVGVAVAGQPDAATHAKHEALERFYFSQHKSVSRPFLPLGNEDEAILREIQSEFMRCNQDHGTLSLYRMATPAQYHGLVATISRDRKIEFLGLALGEDIHSSIFRAFLEAMSNFAFFRDRPEEFAILRKNEPDLWNCSPDFLSQIEELFHAGQFNHSAFVIPNLVQVPLDISQLSELSGCPISPVKFNAEGGS